MLKCKTEPELTKRSKRQSNTKLSNKLYCACWTIHRYSRNSSPYCSVTLGQVQGEKDPYKRKREINAMNNEMVDPRLTAKIVESYVGHHAVRTDQLSEPHHFRTSNSRAAGETGSG